MSSTCCRTSSRPTFRSGWKLRTRSYWTLTSENLRRWTWTWRTYGWIITGWGEWVRRSADGGWFSTRQSWVIVKQSAARVNKILLRSSIYFLSPARHRDVEDQSSEMSHQFVLLVRGFTINQWKFSRVRSLLSRTTSQAAELGCCRSLSATCDFRGKPFVRQQTELNWHWRGDLSKYYDFVCGVTLQTGGSWRLWGFFNANVAGNVKDSDE